MGLNLVQEGGLHFEFRFKAKVEGVMSTCSGSWCEACEV